METYSWKLSIVFMRSYNLFLSTFFIDTVTNVFVARLINNFYAVNKSGPKDNNRAALADVCR